jgi:hypothetical protein
VWWDRSRGKFAHDEFVLVPRALQTFLSTYILKRILGPDSPELFCPGDTMLAFAGAEVIDLINLTDPPPHKRCKRDEAHDEKSSKINCVSAGLPENGALPSHSATSDSNRPPLQCAGIGSTCQPRCENTNEDRPLHFYLAWSSLQVLVNS